MKIINSNLNLLFLFVMSTMSTACFGEYYETICITGKIKYFTKSINLDEKLKKIGDYCEVFVKVESLMDKSNTPLKLTAIKEIKKDDYLKLAAPFGYCTGELKRESHNHFLIVQFSENDSVDVRKEDPVLMLKHGNIAKPFDPKQKKIECK